VQPNLSEVNGQESWEVIQSNVPVHRKFNIATIFPGLEFNTPGGGKLFPSGERFQHFLATPPPSRLRVLVSSLLSLFLLTQASMADPSVPLKPAKNSLKTVKAYQEPTRPNKPAPVREKTPDKPKVKSDAPMNRIHFASTEQDAVDEKRRKDLLEPEGSVRLGRLQAVEEGWKSNLSLRAERLQPEKERAAILSEEGIFDPLLRASIARSRLTELIGLTNSNALQTREGTNINAEIEHLTAEGIRYSLVYRNSLDRYLFNQVGLPGVSGNGSVYVSLTVPILKGNGSLVTTANIAKAERRYQAAMAAVQEQSHEIGGKILSAYYNLILSRRVVNSRIHSLGQVERHIQLLEFTIAEGRSAPFELFEARQQAIQRDGDVQDGMRLVIVAEHDLRRLMGRNQSSERIIPVDEMPVIPDCDQMSLESLQAQARMQRPVVSQARFAYDEAEIERKRNENLAQPQLDFYTDYRITQQGATDQGSLGSGNNWQFGLQFSTPLGNRQSEGLALKSKAEVEQASLRIADAIQRVDTEVSLAWEEARVQKRRVERAAEATRFASSFARAEEERFLAGYIDSSRAIFSQQQEVNSTEYEARVFVDYLLAQAKLLRALGFSVPEIVQPQPAKVREEVKP
jgi:outer membrane protein TolC